MKKNYLLTVLILFRIICFAQWNQVNNGITSLSSGAKLLGSSNTYLFSGTLSGQKMYRTNNNGNNWSEINPPVVGNVPECGYYFSGKYFSGLNSSMDCIYYTNNDGTTWNAVTGGPQTTVVRGFTSLSGNLFAFTSNKGVYKSSDGGITWAAANSGLTNLNVIWVEIINTKLIAGTIGAGVFVSSDNGSTWLQSNTGIAGGDLNANLIWRMGTKLYYIEQGGASYSSNNDGASWTVWTKPSVMGLGVNEIYRNVGNLYIESRHFSGGLKDSVYVTLDEGLSWTNITSNLLANDLNASGITEFGGFVFIAYNLSSPNKGIYRYSGTVGISEKSFGQYITIYPNPVNDKLYLSNTSNQEIKQVSIINSQGKVVLISTENPNSITMSNLDKGLYTIEIITENGYKTHKKLLK